MQMLEELVQLKKAEGRRKPSSEIGKVIAVTPFLIFEINGQTYSSENFTMYVPAIDRIKQWRTISTNEHTEAYVDVGDLELEPDTYSRLFLVGDLIDVTDRGDTFIVHGRLVKL